MTNANTTSPKASEIEVGQALPEWALNLTSTMIVAGAIASRDFMPAHHDPDYARGQGAPDLFLNILTTNGYVARYVTDWAGPEAMLKNIRIRLGSPAIPGQPLRFNGSITNKAEDGDECLFEVTLAADNALGSHATGTVEFTLPRD